MARPQPELLLQHLRRLAGGDAAAGSDAELLRHFLGAGDEAAFTALVRRHGTMVWQVCRVALGQREDAEDVFQATFLVLARKAGSVRKPESLACWLHGVALCLARKVRARNLRRRTAAGEALQRIPARPPEGSRAVRYSDGRAAPNALDDLTWRELRQVLHEELGRLPEKNRLPILLCHLEGRTQDEAARALGWSLGRLRGRLLRGRELLRRRLERRGLAPSVPLLAAGLFSGEAGAAPPAPLVAALGKSAAALARHEAVPAAGPLALAERFPGESALFGNKIVVTFAGALLSVLGALGLLAHLAAVPAAPQSAAQAPAEKPVAAQDGKDAGPVLKDQLGDRLPAGALLRLGTLRFRNGGVVRALAFARDGKTLCCAGWDKTIRRWDAQTGAELEPLPGPKKGCHDAAVSADGKTLVGGTAGGKVHVWDLTAGKEVKQIAVPGALTIGKVAVAPDGRTAAVAGDNAVRLLDLTTGAQLRVLIPYKQTPSALAFSADGKLVASACYDGNARVHEADTGKEVCQLKSKKGAFVSLCFTPDGKTLLAGEQNAVSSDGNPLFFWDVQTGQLRRRLDEVAGRLWALQFAPDGKTFAGGTSKGVIHLWETATARQLHRIKGHADNVQALAFSADGGALASGGSERCVRLWDTGTGKQLNPLVGHQERVIAVAAAPRPVAQARAGKVVATAAWDHSVRLWDADTGRELRRFDLPPKKEDSLGTSFSLTFSPDGRWLAAAGFVYKVWLWDLEKGEPARTFPCIHAALSPDGKHLVTAGFDSVAHLYETGTGKEVRKFKGHLSGITFLSFTPDGQSLVTAGYGPPLGMRGGDEQWDKQAFWLWDVATGKVRRQFGGEFHPRGLALSPDGRTLSASGQLWELATGQVRAALHGPGDDRFAPNATAFTPDGTYLASGSDDGTVHLWRLPGCKHVHTFAGHRGWVLGLAFTPDGKKLVSGSLDTTALVWKMPPLPSPPPARLTPADLEKRWADLASPDAKAAYQAIAALAAAPGRAVSFLGEKLKPAAAPDPKRVARLLADLDSKDFAARQQATAALEKLAELVVPALRAALANRPALEAARRIEKILDVVACQPLPPDKLRDLRAVEALEYIATPNAQAVLQALGQGAGGAHLTRDAQAALLRLGKGPVAKGSGADH